MSATIPSRRAAVLRANDQAAATHSAALSSQRALPSTSSGKQPSSQRSPLSAIFSSKGSSQRRALSSPRLARFAEQTASAERALPSKCELTQVHRHRLERRPHSHARAQFQLVRRARRQRRDQGRVANAECDTRERADSRQLLDLSSEVVARR